jgi:imidazoleglycerol-phosphate dehydratase
MRQGEYSKTIHNGKIKVNVNLDGKGIVKINTGKKFFDHLITTLGTHSLMDLTLEIKGKSQSNIIGKVAICLGRAIRNTLGKGEGINNFGFAIVPMDDALAFTALDLMERPYAKLDLQLRGDAIEDTLREDLLHFLETFATALQGTLHVWVQYGTNDHHQAEAAFKALALALKHAITQQPKDRTSLIL